MNEDVGRKIEEKMKLEVLDLDAVGEKHGSILFVHGALHGAWCWNRFMKYFSEHGYDCHAFSFRGHGKSEGAERINDFSLDDYVADLSQVLDSMKETPIVVAHSLGGMVLQRYMGEHAPVKSISQAVFLASMPVGGTTTGDQLKMLFKHWKATKVMMDINGGKPFDAARLKDAVIFSERLSEADVKPYVNLIKPESTRVGKEQAKPATNVFNVGIPVHIIGSNGDWMFSDQSENSASYKVKPIMLDGLCHDMMLDPEWEKAAKAVLESIESSEK
jgi:pimeloyl-ACP methyl ester carboxylesterase